MTPKQIIEMAKEQGVHLFTDGQKIRFKAPDGTMTPELKEAIRENKQEIIRELEKKQDIAFDILDRLLGGGRTTTMNIWRKRCREAGVGELDMWRARLEIEQMELGLFEKDGTIKLKEEK